MSAFEDNKRSLVDQQSLGTLTSQEGASVSTSTLYVGSSDCLEVSGDTNLHIRVGGTISGIEEGKLAKLRIDVNDVFVAEKSYSADGPVCDLIADINAGDNYKITLSNTNETADVLMSQSTSKLITGTTGSCNC